MRQIMNREYGNSRHLRSILFRLLAVSMLLATCLVPVELATAAGEIDSMSLDRWKLLRETERYQLNIAERYYKQKEWKVAAAEYDKYVSLYERSEAASYALLKWGICQTHLRKANTAIKEGFQSVVDYWPDGPDAVKAAYYIGQTYKAQGELKKAKRAYRSLIEDYENDLVAVFATSDLVDIASVEEDEKGRLRLLNKLVHETKRERGSQNVCRQASINLADYYWRQGSFEEGRKALATSYAEPSMPYHIYIYLRSPLSSLAGSEETKSKAVKVSDDAVKYITSLIPVDVSEEKELVRAKQYWGYAADVLAHARQYKAMRTLYDNMIKKYGVDDAILGRIAELYKSLNQYDKARETFGRYQNLAEGRHQVGYSFQQQRQYKKAVAVYEELLKNDIENQQRWLWQLGYNLHRDGQYRKAIANYRQCTNFPSNTMEMAACHRGLKEYSEAIILYNQVIGGSVPNASWALLQIGFTREQAGQKEIAIKTFQAVCKQYNDRRASEAHAHLQNKYKISVTLGGGKKGE